MPAPKGNKNAVGNNGGRPPLYSDPIELQKKVDEYFEGLKGEFHYKEDDEGEKIKVWDVYPENATITGLILYIGFESRSTFYEYEKKVEFSNIIKRASLRVENEYEKALRNDKQATGSIFALKNMGWSDKSEIDHNINMPNLPNVIIKTK
jgi:hypothetical protein